MSDIDDLRRTAETYEALIEHWFFDAFHGSVVARSTEVWNAVHCAKEDLKRRLVDLLATSHEPSRGDATHKE